MSPSTATLLSALFAKTIELSFVAVFVAFLGQVLSRIAFYKGSKGITIAQMSMRSWVSSIYLFFSLLYVGFRSFDFLTSLPA